MGYYVGPAPESSADAFDDLRCALDDLQGALGEKIAPALLPIADFLAQQIDRIGSPRSRLPTPVTGPTERLAVVCRSCGDAPPAGATFCIECGAPL